MDEPSAFDRRVTPARPDVAAAHLAGKVTAARFEAPMARSIIRPSVALRSGPDAKLPFDTELLLGEKVLVYDEDDDWAWVQSALDDYVGYLPADALDTAIDPTHLVTTLASQIYAEPELKRPSVGSLQFGARVCGVEHTIGYLKLESGGWVPSDHVKPIGSIVADWVAFAEIFTGCPYLWGGRSASGLDCSALVQLARQAAGHSCPRDSDMQHELGTQLAAGVPLRRGDLVFWKGHVGIMRDAETLLHATAFTMQVRSEPLADAAARIKAGEFGEITRIARLDRTNE